MSIHLIIPMAGSGQRFKDAGYKIAKPFIPVAGVPLLERVIKSLVVGAEDKIASITVVYDPKNIPLKFLEEIMDRSIPKGIDSFISEIQDSPGAIYTFAQGVQTLKKRTRSNLENHMLVSADCDTFFDESPLKFALPAEAFVMCFRPKPEEPCIYSYSESEEGRITSINEKEKKTDRASVGIYGLHGRFAKLLPNPEWRPMMINSEAYLSKFMSAQLKMLVVGICFAPKHHCCGTPQQLQTVSARLQKEEKKVFCFDLDATLVSEPNNRFDHDGRDYSTCKPNPKAVKFLKDRHAEGHKIIIYTARRMKTHGGNVEKVLADIGELTCKYLENHNIPYSELIFGKPYADFYIDDKAINPWHEDLEQATGYYNLDVAPRSFNKIDATATTIVKRGNISGEVYYYNNLPKQVEDLFPKCMVEMLPCDVGEEMKVGALVMERLNGIPASLLNARGILKEEELGAIISALHRLHAIEGPVDAVLSEKVRKQPFKKLQSRYPEMFFGRKEDEKLHQLELREQASFRLRVIHGDPVLTNVFICHGPTVKFIDMRGKVDDAFTIYGDPFYDYAKVLQSLLGYDAILHGEDIDLVYSQKMQRIFWNSLWCHLANSDKAIIRAICWANVYAMLPLHDEANRPKFIQMLENMA